MIEERIVISDANVVFDLLSVQLLEAFFALPCEICTIDLVISEILLLQSNSKNNTSIADCSVWYYAKKSGWASIDG